MNPGELVIIQTRTPQLRMVKPETERFDQVQCRTRVRAKAYNIARIRRDLWLVEDDRGQRHDRLMVAPLAPLAAAQCRAPSQSTGRQI